MSTPFNDVDVSLNSFEAIQKLKDDGWIVGVGNNEYKPFDVVTRAEMAVFIMRAKYGPYYQPAIPSNLPSDVDPDYWGAKWIGAALNENLMDLYPDGKFYPRNPASRADMAVIVWLLK